MEYLAMSNDSSTDLPTLQQQYFENFKKSQTKNSNGGTDFFEYTIDQVTFQFEQKKLNHN